MPQLGVLARTALAFGIEEVHLQTWGTTAALLVERGRALAAFDARVVVKVPFSLDGIVAVRALREHGIRTTLTALYAPHQAVTTALVRPDYAAPYLGRISDGGGDGQADVVAMHAILRSLAPPTRLLVASIRSVADLARLALAGLDTYTIAPRLAQELFGDVRTLAAVAAFETAAGGEG